MKNAALSRRLYWLGIAAASGSPSSRPAANPSRLHLLSVAFTSACREDSGGLEWALAVRGVIVSDKVFHNLEKTKLNNFGATTVGSLSGVPLCVRGNGVSCTLGVSRAQFGKLLKQVTSHISSASKIFVQDGAFGASPKCDVKVRVISDSPSAVLSLSNILWETPSRAISHDTCPITVYVASSISSSAAVTLGLNPQPSCGYAAADIERSSLVLCGKSFADQNVVKDALAALAAPVISARGGLPLFARLLTLGDTIVLLFAQKDAIQSWSELHKHLVSIDAGVILYYHGAAPFFWTYSKAPGELKKPASAIFAVADSTGVFPSISKMSPGRAAYQFLAGYHDGNFVPAYCTSPSPIDALELAKALYVELEESKIPSYLVNIVEGGRRITSENLIKLAELTLTSSVPENNVKNANSRVRDLKGKYKSFLLGKFNELPDEFIF